MPTPVLTDDRIDNDRIIRIFLGVFSTVIVFLFFLPLYSRGKRRKIIDILLLIVSSQVLTQQLIILLFPPSWQVIVFFLFYPFSMHVCYDVKILTVRNDVKTATHVGKRRKKIIRR